MTGSEHHPRPRSNAARLVMVVFICVAVLGFLLMAAGFVFNFPIGYSAGLLFIPIGVVGTVVSGIVLIAQPKPAQQNQLPAGAAPGWYPNPENPAELRYFDGRAWTSSTQLRQ
jgi:Protein of unknown function (DUF2510)